MKITTLADLYLDQLQDSHSSERQLIKALPKMAKAAQHPELKAAFKNHLEETREQLERLNRILADLGKTPGRKVCEATAGLVKEGSELIEDAAGGDVCDAGLICAAQKVEHYEIACYGCLHAWATLLGRSADAALLDKTLDEERATDKALTALATSVVNAEAAA
jgi:ferritin-like metal-binding protein YciE